MTEQEIADLLDRTDQRAHHGEGIGVTKEDVERLLEERKRLLDALKEIEPMSTRDCEVVSAAIAFAEEESP